MKELKTKRNIEIDEAFPYVVKRIINKKSEQSCGAGKNFFSVSPDGFLYCCPHWYVLKKNKLAQFLLLGDLKSKKFSQLIKNKKLVEINSFDYKSIKGNCAYCKYLKICKGGCRVAAIYYGDFYGSDPLCIL
jgi:radical SAM protein with 4Fe4S-binding SPASM domain